MAQSVRGKTAIVTGAGSGINLSFATLLLSKGCNVLFADLSLRPEAQEVVNAHTSSPRAVFQPTDVSSWPQLTRMFNTAIREFGQVDIVCPGAGIYEPPFSSFWCPPGQAPSKDDAEGGRYKQLDINLTHPIRVTQMAIAHFLAQDPKPSYRDGNVKTIVHVSSIAGQVTPFSQVIYNCTKHGINALVRSLAKLEETVGIRVVGTAPGVIKTPLWTENPDKLKAVNESSDAWVTPEDVAEVMAALVEENKVSPDLRHLREVKGDSIDVKGGTILEIGFGYVRDVQAFNDPGPSRMPGSTTSDIYKIENDVWDKLATDGWGKF